MLYKRLVTRMGLLAVLFFVASLGLAQQTRTINNGMTELDLSDSAVSGLNALGITLDGASPTHISDGSAFITVVGGAIDLDTASGNVVHSGGLKLTQGNTEVRLESLIIDTTGPSPIVTGLVVVDKKMVGRLPVFNLTIPSGLTLPLVAEDNFFVHVKGFGVTLTAQAASALNSAFSTTGFTNGFDVGMANVFVLVHSK